jgi:Holliday junction resolvase
LSQQDLFVTVLRKEAKKNKTLRLALDADTVQPLIAWAEKFKKIRKETKAAKKEEKNHAVPESCLGKRTKIKHGL